MRNALISLLIATVGILASCSKSETTPDPAAGANFKFTSLVAADTVMKVNGITKITALAEGDGLTYKWTASYGTFLGSGSWVKWTVCHSDKFTISCTVTDQYNHAETKTVLVRTEN